jgi:hypothetical protein
MKMETLQDLYVEQLRDMYSAETQLVKALPKMSKAASHQELRSAFETHLRETETQVERLERIFEDLGKRPGGLCHIRGTGSGLGCAGHAGAKAVTRIRSRSTPPLSARWQSGPALWSDTGQQ